MIRHHPDDVLLLELAAGGISHGAAVVVAAHVERCARCSARLADYEAIGGMLLDELEPAMLAPDALARTLARLDAQETRAPAEESPLADASSRLRASLPPGVSWPRSLRGSAASRWRRLGPNVRFCRVTLAGDAAANVYLLRVAAGKALPVHSHRGGEVTQVLHGAFDDGDRHFAVGDFDRADERVHHRPVVTAAGECICLTSVEGRVAFDGPLARAVGSLLKM